MEESQVSVPEPLTWGDYCAALNYLLCDAPVVDTGTPREHDNLYATYTRFVCNVLYVRYNKLVLSQLSFTQQ